MIAIHGLGYVGLTAAVHWARAGRTVIGYDPDRETIKRMRDGRPRASEFLSYLNEDVAHLVREGKIVPTSDLDEALECQIQSIAVPTERNGEPFDAIVEDVLRAMLAQCASGTVIIVESTLSPGTIDRVLSKSAPLGDRFLAVCPRRDWFADANKNLATLPRVVGGVDERSTLKVKSVLSEVSKKIQTTDYRTAELTKALENALLHVMVMLPTELAINARNLNVAEALKLAGTHWRIPELYLGVGTGGRCVPLGTRYLRPLASEDGLFQRAIDTDRMVRVNCARALAARGVRKALVMGIAYRPDFKDAGLSPGLAVARSLRNNFGVDVSVADPMWSPEELADLTGFPVVEPTAEGFDGIVLATGHSAYATWPKSQDLSDCKIVLDGSGYWKEHSIDPSIYFQVGSAGWLPL